jgi:hypothetical protein
MIVSTTRNTIKHGSIGKCLKIQRGQPSKGSRSRESAPSGQKIRFSRLGQKP